MTDGTRPSAAGRSRNSEERLVLTLDEVGIADGEVRATEFVESETPYVQLSGESQRQEAHPLTDTDERKGAVIGGGARRDDVVEDEDVLAPNGLGHFRAQGKDAPYVVGTLRVVERRLRDVVLRAAHGLDDGQPGNLADTVRHPLALVVAALPLAFGVERHGNNDVDALEEAMRQMFLGHHAAERHGEARASAILDGVEQASRLEARLIEKHRTGALHGCASPEEALDRVASHSFNIYIGKPQEAGGTDLRPGVQTSTNDAALTEQEGERCTRVCFQTGHCDDAEAVAHML